MAQKRTVLTGTGNNGSNRRSFLKASGVALLGSPTGRQQETTTQADSWETLSLAEQLERVRETTAPYKQLDAMAADGYVSSTRLYCGLGYFFDKASILEQPPQPPQPGSLFYVLSADGQLTLGGAEYFLITNKDDEGNPTDPKPDVFNDEDEPLEEKPLAGTREADGWALVDDPASEKLIWALQVWVHLDNPDGVFSHRNPNFNEMPGCVPPDFLD